MDAEGPNGTQRVCWEGEQMVDVHVDMLSLQKNSSALPPCLPGPFCANVFHRILLKDEQRETSWVSEYGFLCSCGMNQMCLYDALSS